MYWQAIVFRWTADDADVALASLTGATTPEPAARRPATTTPVLTLNRNQPTKNDSAGFRSPGSTEMPFSHAQVRRTGRVSSPYPYWAGRR